MYTKNLKLNLNSDNVILFTFLNQDQKPVNISGMSFTFRLIDQLGQVLLVTKQLEITNSIKGQARLVLTEIELQNVDAQFANYSLERTALTDDLYQPVFVDDYASARGVCEIVNQILPEFTPSHLITIPNHGDDETYYSSEYQYSGSQHGTIQYQLLNFQGSIVVQGAVNDAGQWYDIAATEKLYSDEFTGSDYVNFSGLHPKIRIKIQKNTGSLTTIMVR